eukprot:4649282-Pyramimonas_sp.AAC.2
MWDMRTSAFHGPLTCDNILRSSRLRVKLSQSDSVVVGNLQVLFPVRERDVLVTTQVRDCQHAKQPLPTREAALSKARPEKLSIRSECRSHATESGEYLLDRRYEIDIGRNFLNHLRSNVRTRKDMCWDAVDHFALIYQRLSSVDL